MVVGIGASTGMPTTIPQSFYTCLVMITGVFMIAVVIGNVASILASLDAASSAKVERFGKIQRYLRARRVPTDLQRRIVNYIEYTYLSAGASPRPMSMMICIGI